MTLHQIQIALAEHLKDRPADLSQIIGAAVAGISKANAELAAEAFNVANETGLSPRQLADQNAELLAVLQDYDNWFAGFDPENQASRFEGRKIVIRARAVIAKATGAA